MSKFNYQEFKSAVDNLFVYMDDESNIELLESYINGDYPEFTNEVLESVNQYYNIDCLNMTNDSELTEIITEAANNQLHNLKDIFN